MDLDIVELQELSGNKCKIYSVQLNGSDCTLFDDFLNEYDDKYPDQVDFIFNQLIVIGNKTGAREQFLKLNEGIPGDGVCALYDKPHSNLRLFCVRYGNDIIILCGGGYKSKQTRSWQNDPILFKHGELTKTISKRVTQAIKNNEIKISEIGFKGHLSLTDENYE